MLFMAREHFEFSLLLVVVLLIKNKQQKRKNTKIKPPSEFGADGEDEEQSRQTWLQAADTGGISQCLVVCFLLNCPHQPARNDQYPEIR